MRLETTRTIFSSEQHCVKEPGDLNHAKLNAKKWRHTEIQYYDKLSELFANDRANGQAAASAKEKVRQWQRETSSNQSVGVE
ncbi:hypothetical protein L484_014056 [Morus notabilis]|uniref:Uncharacterized protein n=1 Tax=Morus notabilis TaxID=981085 RepID=W9QDJ9_9ROSA|nr:hypothetical protein L484_014056 [Morus notabilis]